MRIWIDIATAPQATFFEPISAELSRRGHELLVTAWDRGQTGALVGEKWPDALMIGAGFSQGRIRKAGAIGIRARNLAQAAAPFGPEVAVSHNSYAQIVAARTMRLGSLTMMDYEHQPANHLAFRLATRVMVPEPLDDDLVRRYGARSAKTVRHPALKEEIALSSFTPDEGFRTGIGVDPDRPLVVIRPAAEGALYHRHRNPIVRQVAEHLGRADATVLVSPRTATQGEEYRGLPGVQVLTKAVSGPNLLFHADLVIGAGGTMTREAAVLGTTSYTAFRGKSAAVDRYLIRQGRLRVLEALNDLPASIERAPNRTWAPDATLVAAFVDQLDTELAVAAGERIAS